MLQELINLVKEHAGSVINNNPAIPADKKEEAVQIAGSSVIDGLKNSLMSGNIKDVLKLFSGGSAETASSPVTETVNNTLTENLSSKLGIPQAQAGGIASSIIPMILSKLVNKTNDPNDKSFDLQSMLNQFSGGKTSGMDVGGIMSKLKGGLDRDGDGDVDLSDLTSMFGGGASGAGGLLDNVKGMFK
ncbi:MAG: DUF937 domain-containing protein [Flavitalea sp.]